MNKHIYKLKEQIFKILENNQIVNNTITILICLSVILLSTETFGGFYTKHKFIIDLLNTIIIIIFTIEYLLRIFVAHLSEKKKNPTRSILSFIFSGYGLIDLVSLLPFYLPLLFPFDLRFLRLLRLMRITRLLKLNRYNHSYKILLDVVKEKKKELIISSFLTALLLIVSAFAIYYLESPYQPDVFENFFSSLWWAIATLTTIGYGDIYPITPEGKLISAMIALLGIGFVALPTGLISAGFIKKYNSNEETQDENEQIKEKIKLIKELTEKGYLTKDESATLKKEIILNKKIDHKH